MKRVLMIALVAVAVAGLFTVAQEVTSVNAVGYVKLTLPEGFSQIRNDFINLDGEDATPGNVFGDALPIGTTLYVWDAVSNKYLEASYDVRTIIDPPDIYTVTNWGGDEITLDQGIGFWCGIPTGAGEQEVAVMGEVPDIGQGNTVPVTVLEGFNLIAYPYPNDMPWVETSLATNDPAIGDTVYVWAGDSYLEASYDVRTIIDPPDIYTVTNWGGDDITIRVGQSFWYKKASAGTADWDAKQQYDL
jgi:hypothetical protein